MEEHTEDGRSRKQMRQGKQRRQRKGIGKEGWRCTYGPGEAERKDHNVLYHQIRQSQDNSELVQELTIKGQRLGVNIVGRTSARRWGIVANQRQMQNPDRAKATGAQESRLKTAGLRNAALSDLGICENGKLSVFPWFSSMAVAPGKLHAPKIEAKANIKRSIFYEGTSHCAICLISMRQLNG